MSAGSCALYPWPVALPRLRHGSEPLYDRAIAVRVDLDLRPFRHLGAVMLALGLALPRVPGHLGLPCPLRTLTGVPCPFCGLTTSVQAVLSGHIGAGIAANPVGLIAIVVAIGLLLRPHVRRVSLPVVVVVGGVGLSWLFQLHRLQFL